jgi:hypothetical protein
MRTVRTTWGDWPFAERLPPLWPRRSSQWGVGRRRDWGRIRGGPLPAQESADHCFARFDLKSGRKARTFERATCRGRGRPSIEVAPGGADTAARNSPLPQAGPGRWRSSSSSARRRCENEEWRMEGAPRGVRYSSNTIVDQERPWGSEAGHSGGTVAGRARVTLRLRRGHSLNREGFGG